MSVHTIRIADTDLSFGCDAGQTLLDAALKAGIELPYSCCKGVCGNCLGGVRRPRAAQADQELYCQFRPDADLEILPASWQAVDPLARKRIAVKVFRNETLSDDVNLLQLRLPAGQRAKFRAGQYLHVLLPGGQRRAYSIANAPQQNDMLTLHVRHVPGGRFTAMLASLARGDVLEVELPFGSVRVPADSTDPLLCVAGGTGFAPVKSLLDDLAGRADPRPVSLVWGGRRAADLYLVAALAPWRRRLPDFDFIPAIEHPDGALADPAPVVAGRVDDAIRARFRSLRGCDVYCCGAPRMVEVVRELCVGELELDAARFHADAFVPGPAAA